MHPPPQHHFLEFKFPWLESRPWFGYIAGVVGMFAGHLDFAVAALTHSEFDAWLDTFAKLGGLFVLTITAGIQILNFRRKLRDDTSALDRFQKIKLRAASVTRFFHRRKPKIYPD